MREAFYRNIKSVRARVCFACHQIVGRLGGPEWIRRALRYGVQGVYASHDMRLELRPGTWDAWTAHPGHEPETHAWIASQFSGGVLVDVGAYCGSFSLRYADRFEKIYLFEASGSNYSALIRNIELSQAEQRVVPIRAAVTERSGTVRLYLNQPDTHSLVGAGLSEDVPSVSLNDSLPDFAAVTLIKIDVEGAELGVLQGATRLLDLGKATIIAEANDDLHAIELAAFLAAFRYKQTSILDGRNYVFCVET